MILPEDGLYHTGIDPLYVKTWFKLAPVVLIWFKANKPDKNEKFIDVMSDYAIWV